MAIYNGKPVNAYSLADAAKLRRETSYYSNSPALLKSIKPSNQSSKEKRETRR